MLCPLLTLNGGVCSSAVVLQVLIFSQMTSILDILMDYCYLRGFQYSRLDGSMAYADREENVSDGDLQLHLIQLIHAA